ncbi:MAG TPA: PilZ domain-containing protein [Terriglobales bacterium]|nr:PilZ domain-containing protein [Terriglobales bacterium]
MSETNPDRGRRRFERFDTNENVRAVDESGVDIGRVEKVAAGGMQIRLAETTLRARFQPGTRIEIKVVESGHVQQVLNVEVRVCDGDLLGVQFLN